VKIAPWLNLLATFLKFGVPLAGKSLEVVLSEVDVKNWEHTISLLEEITQDIPKLPTFESIDRGITSPALRGEQEMVGPALRVLQSYLETVDRQKFWGDLHRMLTPDGHILWLCASHRQQYEAKPLQLNP
jgi:hypothetical protein